MNPTTQLNEILTDENGWIPSGFVWFKVKLRAAKVEGDYLVVQLGWVGLKELAALMEFAHLRKWEGFKDDISTLYTKALESTPREVQPVCPDHKKPMRLSNFTDEWICTKRVGGDFCQRKAHTQQDGSIIIK